MYTDCHMMRLYARRYESRSGRFVQSISIKQLEGSWKIIFQSIKLYSLLNMKQYKKFVNKKKIFKYNIYNIFSKYRKILLYYWKYIIWK